MLVIPLEPIPAQFVTVRLANQLTQVSVYQKAYGLFADVRVNDGLIIAGVICWNLKKIVRSTYLGFIGDLYFFDTQGRSDPFYQGLGTRFQLAYLEAAQS